MVALSKVKAGEVYYSVERQRAGNTTMRRDVVYSVRVKEVFLNEYGTVQSVLASWNGNAPQRFYPRSIEKWRVTEPTRKPDAWELARAAMKAREEPQP